MTARIHRPDAAAEGVIAAQGTQNIGFTFYLKDGRLAFDYNIFADHHVVRSAVEVPIGECTVQARFTREGATGRIALAIDGEVSGEIEVPYVMRMLGSTGLDIGRDSLSPVTDDYAAPFAFTGTLRRFEVELPRRRPPSETREDAEVRFRTEMSQQ